MIGMAGTAALNAYTATVLQKPAALLFSADWWTQWFPCYMVWLVFLTIGGTNWIKTHLLS